MNRNEYREADKIAARTLVAKALLYVVTVLAALFIALTLIYSLWWVLLAVPLTIASLCVDAFTEPWVLGWDVYLEKRVLNLEPGVDSVAEGH